MQVSLFDFDLPESLIALRPVQPRDQARLLHVGATGQRSDACVADLPALLKAGDALVVNVTKVIPARLLGLRLREGTPGAKIEFTLTQRLGPVDWKCFLKPAKKVKDGDRIEFNGVQAVISKRQEGSAELHFEIAPEAMETTLSELGSMPLPPYIASKRAPDARDMDDYQTLFATQDGAVAAPTAGLHFTPELVAALSEKGVELHKVTLHVGPGTFVPVKVEDTDAHIMHGEWGQVTQDTATALNAVKAKGGRIVCVGTTSMRLLESATGENGVIEAFEDDTDIFITPGYRFRAVDLLLTNFHLPKSTLFMLISAFSGLETMQSAYAHAIANGYRFYSYGDACLLERQVL
ncbi:tRNA preQ1(34) S-adenosylmethionine ribosyltransferase-isomerase QueA [Alphaproteobacteria bacterium]|nr:tRNA preQ1(34) S-adenosylmethionine ribosyltransferase-isomerase QueA [Alphaproteobacteria bacterium]